MLTSAVADAAAGRGRVVVIEGPAGIGNTALLEAARKDATARSMAILFAHGGELERDFGFGLVRTLLHCAVRNASEDLFTGQAQLAASVLGRSTGGDPDVAQPPNPVESAFAALHGLYWVLAGLAAERPLVLLVDDAHWADPASVRLLAYAARRLQDLPVPLALSSRSGGDAELLLRALAAVPGARILEPAPLSDEATGSLVRAIVPAAPSRTASRRSPGTIEYHLAGAYRKLAIDSRRLLADALREAGSEPLATSAPT